MRVAAQIPQRMFGSSKRRFAVDDPVLAICLPNERGEDFRVLECCQAAVESQAPLLERFPETGSEFSTEDFLQDSERQEECGLRRDPSAAAGTQASGRNHAMNMRMMFPLLVPCVEHTEEPDIGPQQLWVLRNLKQGFRT